MSEVTIQAELEHVEHVSISDDIWRSERTYTERNARFPVEIRVPEKPPAKAMNSTIHCLRCGDAFRVEIRSRMAIMLSWFWNVLLWTVWAIPLLFVVGKLIGRAISDSDLAVLSLLLPFGFIYFILPTNVALHMTANIGRLNFTGSRSLGVSEHYLYPFQK